MDSETSLRRHLVDLLESQHAHVTFERAIDGLPSEARGQQAAQTPYTIWEILEHMRICQRDILEFSRNAEHVSPEWPSGYWPASLRPEGDAGWENSLQTFRSDLETMKQLVSDPEQDLFTAIPHGDGQTILREVLLLADHNAYHVGQIVLIRKVLGLWDA